MSVVDLARVRAAEAELRRLAADLAPAQRARLAELADDPERVRAAVENGIAADRCGPTEVNVGKGKGQGGRRRVPLPVRVQPELLQRVDEVVEAAAHSRDGALRALTTRTAVVEAALSLGLDELLERMEGVV